MCVSDDDQNKLPFWTTTTTSTLFQWCVYTYTQTLKHTHTYSKLENFPYKGKREDKWTFWLNCHLFDDVLHTCIFYIMDECLERVIKIYVLDQPNAVDSFTEKNAGLAILDNNILYQHLKLVNLMYKFSINYPSCIWLRRLSNGKRVVVKKTKKNCIILFFFISETFSSGITCTKKNVS